MLNLGPCPHGNYGYCLQCQLATCRHGNSGFCALCESPGVGPLYSGATSVKKEDEGDMFKYSNLNSDQLKTAYKKSCSETESGLIIKVWVEKSSWGELKYIYEYVRNDNPSYREMVLRKWVEKSTKKQLESILQLIRNGESRYIEYVKNFIN